MTTTSFDARQSIDATALEALVLQAVAEAGWRGATADEVRAAGVNHADP